MKPPTRTNESTDSFLLELHQAHERVLCAMEALGCLTRESAADEQRVSLARWKLSTASMHRRMLWRRIFDFLAPGSTGGETAALQRLQSIDAEMLQFSTDHIGKWTIPAVLRDWSGYCDASRAIRRQMIAHLEEEKRILYPMLRKFCSSANCRDAMDRTAAA